MGKTKLELTWIGKEDRPRLEPRVLIQDVTKSFHSKIRREKDQFDNRLIFGDNLLALKALENEFAGKIKCIFIDPPYNTGNAFELYDDGREHSIWLSLMRDRLEILRRLLTPDGFFCCQIDDSEGPYLKVLLDEIFGRRNYLTTFFIQVRYGNKTLAEDNDYQKLVEQCFVYAKDRELCEPKKDIQEYTIDKFEWVIKEKSKGKDLELGGKKVKVFSKDEYEIFKVAPNLKGLKETWATGSLLKQKGSSGEFLGKYLAPRKEEDGLGCLYKVYGIGEDGLGHRYFTGPRKAEATKGKFYSGIPLQRLDELEKGIATKATPIVNFYDLSANFGNCRNEGSVDFRGGKKPEKLLWIILKHFSNAGDWVLDSFAGSGTTGAVAHKMGRRWIMIEMGEHAHTHVIPRLQKVVDGSDQNGISEVVGWKGGGGFRYYRVAPTLIKKDTWGNEVINPEFNAEMVAEAVCKLEGFTYEPSDSEFWRHGQSTENDFIYVTTQTLTVDQLNRLSDEVGSNRSLLVCCGAWRPKDLTPWGNLTLKKIPKAVLDKAEWDHDDYNLAVNELPIVEDDWSEIEDAKPSKTTTNKKETSQVDLFSESQTIRKIKKKK
jgi:adenine-specific DNA-methyltransferase